MEIKVSIKNLSDKVKYYLTLEEIQLMREMREIAQINSDENWFILEELKSTQRYVKDKEFRAIILYTQLNHFIQKSGYEAIIILLDQLLEIVHEIYHITVRLEVYFRIAYTYQVIHLPDIAIRYYQLIIQTERDLQRQTNLTALSNHNISYIYRELGDYDLAIRHNKIAIEQLKEKDDLIRPKAKQYLIRFTASLTSYYIHTKSFDQIEIYFNKLRNLIDVDLEDSLDKAVMSTSCKYYMIHDDIQKRQFFLDRLFYRLDQEKDNLLVELFNGYYDTVYLYQKEDTHLKHILLRFHDHINKLDIREHIGNFYRRFIAYFKQYPNPIYLKKGYYALHAYYKNYHRVFNEEFLFRVQEHISQEISLQKNLMELSQSKDLQLLNNALQHNKKTLLQRQEILKRINHLGQQLTTNLNIKSMCQIFFSHIDSFIDLDRFLIFVFNKKKNQLESKIFYENNQKKEKMIITLKNDKNVYVSSFVRREMIHSKKRTLLGEGFRIPQLESNYDEGVILTIPLQMQDRQIGLISIESNRDVFYHKEQIEDINLLASYLAISLSLAIQSKVLKTKIKKHIRDQQKLTRFNQELEKISEYDSLTGVLNRISFERKVNENLQKVIVIPDQQWIHMLMIDIDDFKLYNDTYGHLAGDDALKQVAYCLNQVTEQNEGLFARYGGEEFIAFFRTLDDQSVLPIGQQMLMDILNLDIVHQKVPNKRLTISIGIASQQIQKEFNYFQLVEIADKLLYQAKKEGKNKLVNHSLDSH